MTERKDARQFQKFDLFLDAIDRLIANGSYASLVWHHANMTHGMHTMIDRNTNRIMIRGSRRFLPWHRQYLIVFENLLKSIHSSLSIPYWNWMEQREIPPELNDFQSNISFTTRWSMLTGDMNTADTNQLFEFDPNFFDPDRLPAQGTLQGAMNETDYDRFSLELEGAIVFNDISGTPSQPSVGEGLHNLVHDVIGGIMANTMFSPANPIFWLHHANIDRIWMEWQILNPGQKPQLTGDDAILDPWNPISVDDIINPNTLTYKYI